MKTIIFQGFICTLLFALAASVAGCSGPPSLSDDLLEHGLVQVRLPAALGEEKTIEITQALRDDIRTLITIPVCPSEETYHVVTVEKCRDDNTFGEQICVRDLTVFYEQKPALPGGWECVVTGRKVENKVCRGCIKIPELDFDDDPINQ